jgi:hypothetical protein
MAIKSSRIRFVNTFIVVLRKDAVQDEGNVWLNVVILAVRGRLLDHLVSVCSGTLGRAGLW